MELIFILVEPAVPENIGASARALKTMGFERLRLVNTQQHEEKQAHILAHGSTDLLQRAEVYEDLPSALSDIDFVIGTSAKPRHGWRELSAPAELSEMIASKSDSLNKVAVVFGCEESGLSNEALQSCDVLSGIPLATQYPSLNLSQAVMLYAYELSTLSMGAQQSKALSSDAGQYQALQTKLADLLTALSFDSGSTLYRWAMERMGHLADKDIGFLHALCDKLSEKRRD